MKLSPLLLFSLFLLTSCLNFGDDEYDNSADIAFLEEHAQQEGVTVTDSGLQYRVLEEGDGDSPDQNSEVRVQYVGSLIDGNVFDSSRAREEPSDFPLNGVISGFAEGLALMQVGATYELVIPADIGYGDFPPPGIHPGATLIFEVELLEIL